MYAPWSLYTPDSNSMAADISGLGFFGDASDLTTLSHGNDESPRVPGSRAASGEAPGHHSKKRRCSSTNARTDDGQGTKDAARTLACLSCRQKKSKCDRISTTCSRCQRLGIPCVVPNEDERLRPSSKRRTRELERDLANLQRQMRELEQTAQRNLYLIPPSPAQSSRTTCNDDSTMSAGVVHSQKTSSAFIASLCREGPRFRADDSGLIRYYGPTSSLHTSEKPPVNSLKWDDAGRPELREQERLSPALRDHLLQRYWRFQHQILQVVHREAFLQDMQAGRSRYYSKALLYAILVNAAVFSEVPEIRALALSKDEDVEGSKPYLLRKAAELVEDELEHELGITTVQSLQLLSAVYSRRGQDTKGYLESGRSVRLAFELGLHKAPTEFSPAGSSALDLEVRQVVFWGSFAYDRGWGLYLGRPCAINLHDVAISPYSITVEENSQSHTDLSILRAWATLFSIVGEISHAVNEQEFTQCRLTSLRQDLLTWESSLEPDLRHSSGCASALYVLQLQFHGAMILLHQPRAKGSTHPKEPLLDAQDLRATRLKHVLRIGCLLTDYRAVHGSAMTLHGVAMYNITAAAVVLIAFRAEQPSEATNECLSALTACIAALEEIQCCHMSAKIALKQIRYLMRRCKLLETVEDSQVLRDANASILQRQRMASALVESPPIELLDQVLQQDWSASDVATTMDSEHFRLMSENYEALMTASSWNQYQDAFV